MTPAMPVTAVMVPVPMMPVMVADLLQFGTCEIILICNRGLRCGVRLGLRAIHQILMRGASIGAALAADAAAAMAPAPAAKPNANFRKSRRSISSFLLVKRDCNGANISRRQ